jgi:hypothetical protein
MGEVRDRSARFIREHRHHWRKAVAEAGAEEWLTELVLSRLAGLGLVTLELGAVTPRPALGRFALRATPGLVGAAAEADGVSQ